MLNEVNGGSSSKERRMFLRNMVFLSLGSPLALSDFSKNRFRRTSNRKGEFVPVMLTPYLSDYKIDWDGLDRLTDFYLKAGAGGFFARSEERRVGKDGGLGWSG